MKKNLFYDIGMHKGEDTDLYLKKGFNIVAVEAHADFCIECTQRYQHEIDSGKLAIVNKAVSEAAGPVSFFVNEKDSVWGTINPEWAERNKARGFRSHQVTIESMIIKDVIQHYGVPHYMKIDIEGADTLCLKGL